ncbi:S49 family peptidase [Chromobacterium violaceum]|uniref:S49 family peptidase n=1 Tax=Chromobacterium violaceum TaxID=536 RepID=UPI00195145DB|nr:S49 family peptidase [Chromobacterium violaceum]QRO34134.1 S49 family peptidase [Chromobacterium violaceum]QRQ16063.1 S49 family peptidase [Chromobacterium violaceum]
MQSLKYPQLFGQLYNTPLMLLPDKADELHSVMSAVLFGGGIRAAQGDDNSPRQQRPYRIVGNGVALIPVMGPMVQRGGWIDAMCGIASYDQVASLVAAAMADGDVRAVLLEVDSPGGSVAGLFTLVDRLQAWGEQKPIWTYANEAAFSAAYAVASATEKIYLPSTAMVGSIGVIAMHVDQSKRDLAQGYSYTPIFAGAKKAAGNSHAPLDDATRADMQREIDRLYGKFADHVAAGRSLDRQAVAATEAGLLNADDAVAGGFADGIASIEDVIQMLSEAAQPRTSILMKGKPVTQQANTDGVITQAVLDAATAKAGADARATERTRIAAILDLPQAAGREALARKLALTTDMDAATAGSLLEAAPAAAKQAPAAVTPFEQHMDALGNPEVGASGERKESSAADIGASIAALINE